MIKALGGNAKDAAYVAFAGGGVATAAILGNQVTAGISGYSEFEEHIKSGKMIALATSGRTRISGTNVPTMTELGMNVVMTNWRGIFAPPGITAAQRSQLMDFVGRVVNSNQWKEELVLRKWDNAYMTEAPFQRELNWDIERIGGLLKELGLA
jgi:putative tricarboxylic transport membrane protein